MMNHITYTIVFQVLVKALVSMDPGDDTEFLKKQFQEFMAKNDHKFQIPFQLGLSKVDLRKVVKSSLSGVDKSISAMYKKLQKNLTSEELLPSLWDKCKKEFLDKYDSFAQLVARIYPTETIPSVAEMRDLLATM